MAMVQESKTIQSGHFWKEHPREHHRACETYCISKALVTGQSPSEPIHFSHQRKVVSGIAAPQMCGKLWLRSPGDLWAMAKVRL